ncbi:MAG: hypothetical protein GY769_00970 [bacterium]|nr:hypothetical protein [bacterium]
MTPRSTATFAAALLLITLGVAPTEAQRRGDCRGAVAAGSDGRMAPDGEPGDPMKVTGRVLDSSGTPLAGVNILAYQTDKDGYYSPGGENESDARLCAVVHTNQDGEYSLTTIRPGSYPTGGVPEHIHFELWSDEIARQRRDLQFADDELVPERRKRDLTRTSTVRPLERDADGVWHVERDFLLR